MELGDLDGSHDGAQESQHICNVREADDLPSEVWQEKAESILTDSIRTRRVFMMPWHIFENFGTGIDRFELGEVPSGEKSSHSIRDEVDRRPAA